MKIEKLNDHEIRCTLTLEDLESRHLKLSELAYGNDKTKRLFRDMVQQAAFQYGFDAENTPLMVEAVPVSTDCIVVSITKVDDPDELDARFSKFSPSVGISDPDQSDGYDSDGDSDDDDDDDDDNGDDISTDYDTPDEVYNDQTDSGMTDHISGISAAESGQLRSSDQKENIRDTGDKTEPHSAVRFFSFTKLRDLAELSNVIPEKSGIKSSLYKNRRTGEYLLIVSSGSLASSRFNQYSIQMSEYITPIRIPASRIPLIEESFEVLIRNNVFDTFK